MKWVLIVLSVLIGIVAVVVLTGAMLPKNHVASRSSRFRKSPQEVWDVITGPPDWRPEVRRVEILAPRQGRRTWKEIDSHGESVTYESVEETPHQKLVTRIADPSLPYGGTWTHEIKPEADGCVLTITEAGEIYNPIFRFMARFVFGYSSTIDSYLKALHAKLGGPAEEEG